METIFWNDFPAIARASDAEARILSLAHLALWWERRPMKPIVRLFAIVHGVMRAGARGSNAAAPSSGSTAMLENWSRRP